MKKFFGLLMTLTVVCAFAIGCGEKKKTTTTSDKDGKTTTTTTEEKK